MYIEDLGFYCYLRGALLRQILVEPGILDTLLKGLEVPGKPPQLKRLPVKEKLSLIEGHIEYLRGMPSSLWRGIAPPEIMAASLWRSSASDRSLLRLFGAVRREEDLREPIAAWLTAKKLSVHHEVSTGTKRPDLIGHEKGGFFSSEYVVAVELKNDLAQLRRGLDQMTTFGQYARHVYLACSPAMAAEYLDHHASARTVRHWDPKILESKLKEFGFGLLLVDGTTVSEVFGPRQRDPSPEKLREILEVLRGRTP